MPVVGLGSCRHQVPGSLTCRRLLLRHCLWGPAHAKRTGQPPPCPPGDTHACPRAPGAPCETRVRSWTPSRGCRSLCVPRTERSHWRPADAPRTPAKRKNVGRRPGVEEAHPDLNPRSEDPERGSERPRVWVSSSVPGPSAPILRVRWETGGTRTLAPCPAHSRCSATSPPFFALSRNAA